MAPIILSKKLKKGHGGYENAEGELGKIGGELQPPSLSVAPFLLYLTKSHPPPTQVLEESSWTPSTFGQFIGFGVQIYLFYYLIYKMA